jgi:hypothetical protein
MTAVISSTVMMRYRYIQLTVHQEINYFEIQ